MAIAPNEALSDRAERELLVWFRKCEQIDREAILRFVQLMSHVTIPMPDNVVQIRRKA